MKKKIKDFSKFVNEKMEMSDNQQDTQTIYGQQDTERMDYKRRPNIGTIPEPRQYDFEDDMSYGDDMYGEEEEGNMTMAGDDIGNTPYIGDLLMNELQNKLDELGQDYELVDNAIIYQDKNGEQREINFYSEINGFDIDGVYTTKDEDGEDVQMTTVDQVLNYLGIGENQSMAQAQSSIMMQERFRPGRGRGGRI